MVPSLPAWGVWIEIKLTDIIPPYVVSLPAWGVWIEIRNVYQRFVKPDVTPRMGSVD